MNSPLVSIYLCSASCSIRSRDSQSEATQTNRSETVRRKCPCKSCYHLWLLPTWVLGPRLLLWKIWQTASTTMDPVRPLAPRTATTGLHNYGNSSGFAHIRMLTTSKRSHSEAAFHCLLPSKRATLCVIGAECQWMHLAASAICELCDLEWAWMTTVCPLTWRTWEPWVCSASILNGNLLNICDTCSAETQWYVQNIKAAIQQTSVKTSNCLDWTKIFSGFQQVPPAHIHTCTTSGWGDQWTVYLGAEQ